MRKKITFPELTNIAKNVMFSIKEHTSKLCQRDYIWPPPWERTHWEYILKGLEMCISSVQFSRSVLSDSLRPHESQHARPPCPSPTPGVQTHVHRVSDAIQASHPLLSPFSSWPQSLPASESFPMSQLFTWGGQSTGVSALASFLPKKSQGWSPT